MAIEIIMPKAGVDMTEGEIIKWNKKVGDEVKEGEVLLEILTDKVNMELEAEKDGYLIAILKKEGEKVPVTEVIGYIGEKDEKIPNISNKSNENIILAKDEKKEEEKTDKKDYDLVVIGGGPAGYVAAIKASQLGGKVALVEKNSLGGTCLNRGCIPTKTYLHNVEIIEGIKHAKNRGIILENSNFTVDMKSVLEMKSKVVNTLVGGITALLKNNKIDIFEGTGKITKDKSVIINEDKILKTEKIILASGSKVNKINIPGIQSKLVMTSDDILDINFIPKSLAVIGGGVIGVELGQVFSSFGSKVTIIEMMDRIVPGMDKEISESLKSALKKKGIEILTNTKINEFIEENGKLKIKIEGKEDLIADYGLLSIGRVPDLEGIGEIDFYLENGKIKVNEYMETSIEGIYAPGDINGKKMLAHAAFKMGEIAAENAITGNKSIAKLNIIPAAIYTIPEVAMVGLTEEQAKNKYKDIRIGKFNFAANGRAIASDSNYGFIKIIADNKYGEILGIHIIGPAAAEIINEATIIIESELTVEEVLKSVHGHPTFSEVMYEAFADVLGVAIHGIKKK